MSSEKLDVKTTFLHRELEEDICMQQPKGFVVSSKDDYVCLFKKSIYALKQSPSQWFKRFDDEFVCVSTLVCELHVDCNQG